MYLIGLVCNRSDQCESLGASEAIPEIRGLKTGGAGSIDVQDCLEVLVEGIQEAVCEALVMILSTMPLISCMEDIDCAYP